MNALRFDQGFRLDRVEGSRRWRGIAARPGILTYGSTRELVRPEVLARSAAQLPGRPVTLGHPPSGKAGERDKVGTVIGATIGADGELNVELEITDATALAAIERGDMTQLSPGYHAEVGPGGVDPRFGPYDSEQLSRSHDHVALVANARCGPSCALHTDAHGVWEETMPCNCPACATSDFWLPADGTERGDTLTAAQQAERDVAAAMARRSAARPLGARDRYLASIGLVEPRTDAAPRKYRSARDRYLQALGLEPR